MTIGSSFNYPAELAALQNRKKRSTHDKWRARFPNPPDLCFDYRTLIEQEKGVAICTQPMHKICIIGAGITGLTAARELYRCGFNNISLFEKSKRIGGRHLTALGTHNSNTLGRPPFEMGAMRMLFFNTSNEHPTAGRSLMAYYAKTFDLVLSDFPNPGSPWVTSTGIFLQEGSLDSPQEPTLLIWKNTDGKTPPPGETLGKVYAKWTAFAERLTKKVSAVYASSDWETLWAAIVERYENLSFRDLVKMPSITEWNPARPGDFGGMGMTAKESAIFYAIGIGDGSWGAFYDVCCLYPLRTAIFGFSSHLQLVHGRVHADGSAVDSPHLHAQQVLDSRGLPFNKPNYLGLAALAECLFFLPIPERKKSAYELFVDKPDGLLTDTKVTKLLKLSNGKIRVFHEWQHSRSDSVEHGFEDFDSVIMTLPSWLIETEITLENFTQDLLPADIIRAYKTAHWETSCKVYAPLKKSFLSKNKTIPQTLVTDSLIHDMYTYRYNENNAYDCILMSYTWEDDATKLCYFSDKELVAKCIEELDRILMTSSNIKTPISPYIGHEHAVVQRWMNDKHSLGCAKLYRPGTYHEAVSLMRYNRDYAHRSGLYLCGESFSVDAGWTEPCFRGAIDAVIHIGNKTQAIFNGGFNMSHYPEYSSTAPS